MALAALPAVDPAVWSATSSITLEPRGGHASESLLLAASFALAIALTLVALRRRLAPSRAA